MRICSVIGRYAEMPEGIGAVGDSMLQQNRKGSLHMERFVALCALRSGWIPAGNTCV